MSPDEHTLWTTAHRSRCDPCRLEYNAHRLRHRPAKGAAARPGRWATEADLDRRDWLLDIGAGEVRRACGISQRTVAEALGVTFAAVSAWETGRRVPWTDAGLAYCRVIAAFARHLAVDLEDDRAAAVPPGRRAA